MKWLLLICLVSSATWLSLKSKRSLATPHTNTQKIIKDSISFSNQVQPILLKRCSPCHFTGGKMYIRMPFDHDTTILKHSEGILRRIKTGDDNLIIRSFVEQNKSDNR